MARGSARQGPTTCEFRSSLGFFFWHAAGMSPATAGSYRACLSFLADLSASLLDLLGALWRATEVGTTVEKID